MDRAITRINVLDKGFVELIDYMGGDLDICRAARVDPLAEWRPGTGTGTDTGLIRYMMKNRHTSPFEAVEIKLHVKAPIAVFRHWHRHRTWSYDEISARYSALLDEYYIPDVNLIGRQSETNKQARDFDQNDMLIPVRLHELEEYKAHCDAGFALYRKLLQSGWPREMARFHLPLSTYSRMIGKVDLHNLIHFWDLRGDARAQYEIRVYSDAIQELVRHIVPETMEAWEMMYRGGN